MSRAAPARHRPGQVRDAIFEFLRAAGEADVGEIRDAVSVRLDGNLSDSSVRSYLRLNTPGVFSRTTRGRYRLNGSDEDSLLFPPPADDSVRPAFEYGRCRLFRGDCMRWLASQPDNSIQAIVTDPPYGLVEYSESEKRKLRTGHGGVWRIPPSFDGHQRSPLPRFTVLQEADLRRLEEFFFKWATQCLCVLTPGAHVAVASNPLLAFRVAGALSEAGLEPRGQIVRLVMTMRGGDRPKNAHREFPDVTVMPRSMYEPWLLFRKPLEGRVQDNLRVWKTGGLRRVSMDKPFGDVIASHPTRPDERRIAPHPSLKPQSFLRKLVRAMLPLGEGTLLDPFAGSGSTLAAAEAVGYPSIGIENDEMYVEMAKSAIARLHHLPSKPA